MSATGTSPRVDLQRLAQAIAHTESGCNDLAMGVNGERGRYQFQEQLWRSITPVFFGAAHDPHTSTRVAVRHLEWLTRKLRPTLENHHWPVFVLALGWKAGPQAVLHGFTTLSQREFAVNVQVRYDGNEPIPNNQLSNAMSDAQRPDGPSPSVRSSDGFSQTVI